MYIVLGMMVNNSVNYIVNENRGSVSMINKNSLGAVKKGTAKQSRIN